MILIRFAIANPLFPAITKVDSLFSVQFLGFSLMMGHPCFFSVYFSIRRYCGQFKRLRLSAFLLASLLSVFTINAFAQEPEIPKKSDVRLVIDISGSMKKNDPKNLRRPAVDMLVQLLPKGSKAGIWTFGQYVNMVVPHKVVNARWGKKAIKASASINSIAQFTNIGEALEQAAYDAQQSGGDFQRHVILLTDGVVDIDRDTQRNQEERQRILNTVMPLYESAGIVLHTIALSDNADTALLNKLAFKTEGKAAVAKTAEELMNVFLQVFDQAVPLEEAIFDGENFVVDSSIEEFTALIFRQPNAKNTEMIGPDGQVYSKVSNDSLLKWHHTDQYDMITISQPLEGEWRVSADLEPQSRVTVVSDLSIAVKAMPTNLGLDEKVQTTLALREENKTITRLEFLGLLDIDVAVTSDTGNEWSQRVSKNLVPEDGLYPVRLDKFNQEGQYTVTFTVDGKSFKRQYTHRLSVRKPFLVDVEKKVKNGANQYVVKVSPQSKNIDVSQTKIVGTLKDPQGNNQKLPFITTDDEAWMLLVSTEKPGNHTLSITVKSGNGEPDISLERIRLSQGSDSSFKIETPVSEEPKVEEPITDVQEELVVEPVEEAMDITSIILYSIIGIVNLLIIVIGYIVYRKFFKKKSEDGSDELLTGDETVDSFVEPPMDDMAVEEIEDEVSEDALDDTPEPPPEEAEPEAASDETPEEDDMGELDLDDDEDVPDFSLDDFSPESLEEEDLAGDMDELSSDK